MLNFVKTDQNGTQLSVIEAVQNQFVIKQNSIVILRQIFLYTLIMSV